MQIQPSQNPRHILIKTPIGNTPRYQAFKDAFIQLKDTFGFLGAIDERAVACEAYPVDASVENELMALARAFELPFKINPGKLEGRLLKIDPRQWFTFSN